MDSRTFAAERARRVWLKVGSASFDTFRDLVSQTTDAAQWPFANTVESNVLIYAGDDVRSLAQSDTGRLELMAEWAEAFLSGPGVIVIRNAIRDHAVIDEATAIFEGIIEEQRATNAGGGDHFAKPGANDRIWNAVQKHCIAAPDNFARYYGNIAIDLASRAWLGDGYQVTAQVNRVNPGGEAQTAHRDYHLGFMIPARLEAFPSHVHGLSPALTLQGAIAHCDMPVESGPTLLLPFSQSFHEGYIAFSDQRYQDWFDRHHVQLPLSKGDAVFFNPAMMHAAGSNVSNDIYRMANLLRVSSAFGRPIEAVDRTRLCALLYPVLLAARQNATMTDVEISCALAAAAQGYAFPTNLDTDPPVGGLAPKSQSDLMSEMLLASVATEEALAALRDQDERKQP
ncbi:phytanoyl-CoA dioxygenase family protein [Hoeflea poritis]|uniref:Phytanoyl-CoA dioxygenase family protein n=1 Tax=Hoeflea poritis TaxID=2993659 RepID=A0ABT4VH98_9HYPH|nr:phytanoyl-CoA dioxygenase family protein [Hoeflea poritis]MDA4844067.1 phytanoyl-CoA dioxygenase family protein [Hoeflea poritis]